RKLTPSIFWSLYPGTGSILSFRVGGSFSTLTCGPAVLPSRDVVHQHARSRRRWERRIGSSKSRRIESAKAQMVLEPPLVCTTLLYPRLNFCAERQQPAGTQTGGSPSFPQSPDSAVYIPTRKAENQYQLSRLISAEGHGGAMNPNRLRAVARRLATAPRTREPPTTTDAELLGGFLDQQDESAFGELVARHLPSVRAVCRTVLRDPNDVDDAVQAAFLILVRRAATVRDARALGGWLYRVAWRVANRLRAKNARRAAPRQVGIDPDSTPAPAVEPAGGAEAFAALHEEVSRLPERYRLAAIAGYAGGTPTRGAPA